MKLLALVLALVACGSDPAQPADAPALADAPLADAPPDAAPPPPTTPRYVYISHAGGIAIGAITDPATGAYRVIGEVTTAASSHLLVAPTGGFLIAAGTGALWVFAIDAASGLLTPVGGSKTPSLPDAASAAFSPDGAYLFVGLGDNTLRPYRFDAATGALAQANVAVTLPSYADTIAVTPDGTRLYAMVGASLVAYAIGADAALAPLAGFPLELDQGTAPQQVRIDPTGHVLALSLTGTEKVAMYALDPATGALSPLPGSPYPTPGNPWSGEFSADGRIYYEACETGLVRSISLVPGSDALIDGPSTPYAVAPGARAIAFDAAHALAYVVQVDSVAASILPVAASGALQPGGEGRAPGGGASGIAVVSGVAAVTSAPEFVYALDDTTSGSITAYTMDATTGALEVVPGGGALVDQPDQAVVDPRGRFLYVISGSTGLHTFAIGATGALTAVGTPIAIGSSPRTIDIAKSGEHLYVGVGGTAQVLTYTIGPSGAPITPPLTFPTPASTPGDVRLDGVGRQLWASTADSMSVFLTHAFTEDPFYSRLASTGAASQPQWFAMSPDGRHAYVPLAGSGRLATFQLGDDVVEPTAVGAPISAGSQPHAAAIDPRGRFVYVTDTGPYSGAAVGDVRAFARDATTGAPTPIAGTFPSLPRPVMATVDPSGAFLVVATTGTINPTTAGGISVFPIHDDGTLGAAANTPLGSFLSWIVITEARR